MTTYDFESDDEGFACVVGGGSCNIEYTFDNWIDPSTGSDDTYDFESNDEGFEVTTTGGNVDIEYTFDNWTDPSEGDNDNYTFELDGITDYNVVDSINAYSTINMVGKTKKYLNPGNMVERRLLRTIEATHDIKRFKGEIR